MKSYKMLGTFAIVAIFTAAFGLAAQPSRTVEVKKGERSAECIACTKSCADCALQCDMCFAHCSAAVAQGKQEHAITSQLCVDCADCCKLASTFTARMSPLSPEACECCAKCCIKCAEACGKFPDDKQMADCAKSCRECAASCQAMLKSIAAK